MGDETKQEGAPAEAEPSRSAAPERRDADGLPLDRAPTLDDVRGTEGSGRTTAVSCTAIVVLLVLGFWLLRAFVLR